jgi:SMC interacting uncharacterized protein involved in chromosome segregation
MITLKEAKERQQQLIHNINAISNQIQGLKHKQNELIGELERMNGKLELLEEMKKSKGQAQKENGANARE